MRVVSLAGLVLALIAVLWGTAVTGWPDNAIVAVCGLVGLGLLWYSHPPH